MSAPGSSESGLVGYGFWDKVEKGEGCWLWTGATRGKGYGAFWDGQRMWAAHRFAHQLCIGPIPEGLCVLHHCDNPPCVNPDHLFLGTNSDNVRDMMKKGRGNIGARHGVSKLTDDAARAIRQRYAHGGVSQRQLAEVYGVTKPTVGKVLRRETWRHVQ